MEPMAEEGLLDGDRVWFSDARSQFRRMGVSSHPEAGVVVLSLWTGDTCTATFRVPLADSARLISALADGLASSLPPHPVAVPPGPPARGWRALVDRFRTRRIPGRDGPTLRRVK
jgi:hypothetical protein